MISIFNGRKRTLGGETSEIYAQIGVKFREHLHHLKGARLGVFMAISLHANKNGWAWPSVSLLAKETGYNTGTINKAIKDLCALTINGERLLLKFQPKTKDNGQFHSNHYLIFPSTTEVAEYKDRGLHNTVNNLPSVENPVTEKPVDEGQPSLEEEPTAHGADAPSSPHPTAEKEEVPSPVGEELVKEYFGPKPERTLQHTTPHYSQQMQKEWVRWGEESEEMQRQLNRFGERGRTVQRVGYELERQFGMRPLWSDPAAVKSWMSGISRALQEAGGNEKLIIQAKRELTGAGLDAPTPYSLRKKVMSLAEKTRAPGDNGGAPALYSDEWYRAQMEADPQYQAFAGSSNE